MEFRVLARWHLSGAASMFEITSLPDWSKGEIQFKIREEFPVQLLQFLSVIRNARPMSLALLRASRRMPFGRFKTHPRGQPRSVLVMAAHFQADACRLIASKPSLPV